MYRVIVGVLGLVAALAWSSVAHGAEQVSPKPGERFTTQEPVFLVAAFENSADARFRFSTERATDASGRLVGAGSQSRTADGTTPVEGQRKVTLAPFPSPATIYWQTIESRCVRQSEGFPGAPDSLRFCEVSEDVHGPVRPFRIVPPDLAVVLGGSSTRRPKGSALFTVPIRCNWRCSVSYRADAFVRRSGQLRRVSRLRARGDRRLDQRATLTFPSGRQRPYLRRLIRRYGAVQYRVSATADNGFQRESVTKRITLRPKLKPRRQRPSKPRRLTRIERVRQAVDTEVSRRYELSLRKLSCRALTSTRYRCDFAGLTRDDIQTGNVDGHSGTATVIVYSRGIDVRIVSYRRGGNA